MHDKSCLHLCPVIWHHFHVIEHWEDPLHQLLQQSIQIIINRLGVTIKNSAIYFTSSWKKRYDKNFVAQSTHCAVMDALAHPDVDGELWDCGAVLWNPPWHYLKTWWLVHSPEEPPCFFNQHEAVYSFLVKYLNILHSKIQECSYYMWHELYKRMFWEKAGGEKLHLCKQHYQVWKDIKMKYFLYFLSRKPPHRLNLDEKNPEQRR